MIMYIARDDNPDGGYYSLFDRKPDMRNIARKSIAEVRQVEMSEEVISATVRGKLPIDPDGHNDSTWFKYWREAGPDAVVWERDS